MSWFQCEFFFTLIPAQEFTCAGNSIVQVTDGRRRLKHEASSSRPHRGHRSLQFSQAGFRSNGLRHRSSLRVSVAVHRNDPRLRL